MSMGKTKSHGDLLQGTLDVLILKTLKSGRQHGWGISQAIGEKTNQALLVKEGSLYPALHRLERLGFVESTWGVSGNNRKAKFYRLTRKGRLQLEHELVHWYQFAAAIELVLGRPEPSR